MIVPVGAGILSLWRDTQTGDVLVALVASLNETRSVYQIKNDQKEN